MSATPAPAMSLSLEELETDSELPRLGTGRTGGRGGGRRKRGDKGRERCGKEERSEEREEQGRGKHYKSMTLSICICFQVSHCTI